MRQLEELKNMPTEYFEIKPLRAVKLNEFVGAIIPEDTGIEIKQILKRNIPNGKIVEYGTKISRKRLH